LRWNLAPSALDHNQFQVLAALHINHLRPLPHDIRGDCLVRVAAEAADLKVDVAGIEGVTERRRGLRRSFEGEHALGPSLAGQLVGLPARLSRPLVRYADRGAIKPIAGFGAMPVRMRSGRGPQAVRTCGFGQAPAQRTDVPEKLYQWPLTRQRVLQSSWPRTCGLDSPTGIVAVKHVPPLSQLSRSEAHASIAFGLKTSRRRNTIDLSDWFASVCAAS
jgi:hypothetical protein